MMSPPEVNLPTLYIAYVLLTLWHSQIYFCSKIAALATVLTVLPPLLFPHFRMHWESVLFNRGTSISLIWIACYMIVERKKLALLRERALEERNQAREEVEKLVNLLPMCAWCKKVRDEDGKWEGIESYLSKHAAAVTHGICPDCTGRMNREITNLTCKPKIITDSNRDNA